MNLRTFPVFFAGMAAATLVILALGAGPPRTASGTSTTPAPTNPALNPAPPLSTSRGTLGQESAPDMKAMMERMERFTAPGENHALLERFLGDWKTETALMMGGRKGPADVGSATVEWLIQGRWLQSRGQGKMMGMDAETVMILGYDNFKMSYVACMANSLDTALNRFEGDLTPDGKALIGYGTLDEYLTGEHDKMVKYVWRFLGDDEMVLEVHDLPIGETGTQVIEVRYTRKE